MQRTQTLLRGGLLYLTLASVGVAETASVSLQLTPPTEESNRLAIGVAVGLASDDDEADVSGQINVDLEYEIDGESINVEGLVINSADLAFTPVSFELSLGLIIVDGTDLGGTITTQNPPTAVADEMFDASDQRLSINQGIFTGTAFNSPFSVDISTLDFGGPATGLGSLAITPLSSSSESIELEAALHLDFDFTGQGEIEGFPGVFLDFSVAGPLEGVAQFSVPVSPAAADSDSDGDIDGVDFLSLQQNSPGTVGQWQTGFGTGGSPTAAVPEPNGAAMLAAWTAGYCGRTRRRRMRSIQSDL